MYFRVSTTALLYGTFVEKATLIRTKTSTKGTYGSLQTTMSESDYAQLFLNEDECTIYLKRVRLIAQEVFKSINGLNPDYARQILRDRPSQYPSRKPLDLYVPRVNQIKFGYRRYT